MPITDEQYLTYTYMIGAPIIIINLLSAIYLAQWNINPDKEHFSVLIYYLTPYIIAHGAQVVFSIICLFDERTVVQLYAITITPNIVALLWSIPYFHNDKPGFEPVNITISPDLDMQTLMTIEYYWSLFVMIIVMIIVKRTIRLFSKRRNAVRDFWNMPEQLIDRIFTVVQIVVFWIFSFQLVRVIAELFGGGTKCNGWIDFECILRTITYWIIVAILPFTLTTQIKEKSALELLEQNEILSISISTGSAIALVIRIPFILIDISNYFPVNLEHCVQRRQFNMQGRILLVICIFIFRLFFNNFAKRSNTTTNPKL
jgi:hypothetical protein